MKIVDYAAYETIHLSRTDGIVELRLHTDDGPLQWSLTAHDELEHVFLALSRDASAEIVILTGTGAEFSGPDVPPGASGARAIPADAFDGIAEVGSRLLRNFLEIPVPVIAAVNGPARRHPELPLMADIVLASDDALFQDPAHFRGGMVPGDGVHVVFPYLMGPTRASYFLLMAEELRAEEARRIGLVNEVMPRQTLVARARAVARILLEQPRRVRRASRALFTAELKRRLANDLDHGFALERYAHIARD